MQLVRPRARIESASSISVAIVVFVVLMLPLPPSLLSTGAKEEEDDDSDDEGSDDADDVEDDADAFSPRKLSPFAEAFGSSEATAETFAATAEAGAETAPTNGHASGRRACTGRGIASAHSDGSAPCECMKKVDQSNGNVLSRVVAANPSAAAMAEPKGVISADWFDARADDDDDEDDDDDDS
jgi:hypothetical protein